MPEPTLVAVAHGSADPRAAATIAELLDRVRDRAARASLPGLDVRAAFLGHCAPSVHQVLHGLDTKRVVVLPLLLTAAYHSKTDLPALLSEVRDSRPRLRISHGGVLGPHPLLLRLLSRRLADTAAQAGGAVPKRTGIVLAAAGSSDQAANATVARLATRLQQAGGWRAVVPGYASAASPSPAEAVRTLRASGVKHVLVASYLLAPGFFADRIRHESLDAGAAAVTSPLGAAPEIAEVVLDRYLAARGATPTRRAA